MKCQYEHGCVRPAGDNEFDLCVTHLAIRASRLLQSGPEHCGWRPRWSVELTITDPDNEQLEVTTWWVNDREEAQAKFDQIERNAGLPVNDPRTAMEVQSDESV